MKFTKGGNDCFLHVEKGEEILECITKLCIDENIQCAALSGIGAVNYVEMGIFGTTTKIYHKRTLEGDFEIVSFGGNITEKDGKPYIHTHIAISDMTYQVCGGHLNKAVVSATAEIVIKKLSCSAGREFNEGIGLNLLQFTK